MKHLHILLAIVLSTSAIAKEGHDLDAQIISRPINSSRPRREASRAVTTDRTIERCADSPGEQVSEIAVVYAYVIEENGRFVRSNAKKQEAYCAPLAVEDGKVLGLIQPYVIQSKQTHYSQLSGEMVGKKPGAMYLLIPNLDPKQPPHIAPLPCDMQVANSIKLGLTLEKGGARFEREVVKPAERTAGPDESGEPPIKEKDRA